MLLNEQTFLAGFCFSYIRKDDRPKKKKQEGGKEHPRINLSLLPMLSACSFISTTLISI